MFKFQKLEIYHLAKEIVKMSYQITRKFPIEEKFALLQQMNRAAISVPSNIAEGVCRFSDKEQIHFVNISYSSLMELVCQMEITLEVGYISEEEYNEFLSKASNLSVKLTNFMQVVQKRIKNNC